ncbi:MAG: family transposase [Mucilaginibacter sp.]|nr:family transposase [Mucilaginibacter sp.]
MPTLKIDKKDGEKYVRIVESYRDESGVSRMRTLLNLGKLDDKKIASLKRLGSKLFEMAGGDPSELTRRSIAELGRYNYGYVLVCKKIFSYYGLDRLLERIAKKAKLQFSLVNAVLLMLCERLHDPVSKRRTFFNQEEYLGLQPAALQHLYRSLDRLADIKEQIQERIYRTGRDLFNQKLDVVFYDVTTFYFESEQETEGALRQKGFSKDGKIGNTQVLMGLLIDKDKQPVAYQVYKGDLYEGHTFKDALNALKQRYQLDQIIVVADRGMLSKANILELTGNHGYQYILGERLKTLPQHIQQPLLELKNYQKEWVMNEQENVIVKYAMIEYEGRRIIGTWSASRAQKDRSERQERLDKAELMRRNPSLLKKKAAHYFLKNDRQENYQIDQQKIERNEKYDGFLAIATNVKDIDTALILDHYKHLYQVEHAFRTFKSYLETRPMFHWTDQRIEGHLCLCYIAYTIQIFISNQLKKNKTPLTENSIRSTLDKMQLSLIEQGGEQYYLRSKQSPQAIDLVEALALKPLPDTILKDQIIKYL